MTLTICPTCLTPHHKGHTCGVSLERRRIRSEAKGRGTYAWQKRRERVKRRDGYTCQRCARHRDELVGVERLEVHLDESLAGNHYLALDEDCLTVCSTCHPKVAVF